MVKYPPQSYLQSTLLWLFLSLILAGCSNNKHISTGNEQALFRLITEKEAVFGFRPKIISKDEIYSLSTTQLNQFNLFYNEKSRSGVNPNRRIFQYLKEYEKQFRYSDLTLPAKDSLLQSEGNCLSLAILTAALAKSADIFIDHQLVETQPMYEQKNRMILTNQHVRSVLYEPYSTGENILDNMKFDKRRKGVIIDYFSTKNSRVRKNLSESEFVSLFYKNKAADAIVEKHFNRAYWLVREAFSHTPNDGQAINMMALIHEKSEQKQQAEKLYKYGLRHTKNKLELLRNYYLLLKKQHRTAEAKRIKAQLDSISTPNPFDWVNLGDSAFNQQKYLEAKRYYRKAIGHAPYLHQAHFGMAKADFKLGNLKRARRSMEKAIKNTQDHGLQSFYKKELDKLPKN